MSQDSERGGPLISPSGLDQTAAAAPRPDEPPPLDVGARISRYQITALLGAGGMGVVYAVWDASLQRKVALKLIKTRAGDLAIQTRFEREAQSMARLSHRNVVGVHDFGFHGGQPFLVMELIQGVSLRAWLEREQHPWRERVAVLIEAARGLGAAHAAGLVHRDFKPENVLVGADGRVAVTDFGLARSFEERSPEALPGGPQPLAVAQLNVTLPHAVLGTPLYMAPEQFAGEATDARTDVFAFGVVLYEALYGQRPFPLSVSAEPVSLESMRAEVTSGRLRAPPASARVPARLQALISRMLRPAPAERVASMEAVVAELQQALKPARSRRAVAVAGLLAVLGGAGGSWWWVLGLDWLGRNRASLGDTAGARQAFAQVLAAWPNPLRSSVHVEDAKARLGELGP